MAINLNPKDVRKVNVSTKGLPKTITGKNDRVKMVQGLEHGHTYNVSVKVIYNDWTEYNTTFTIVRILENRTVVEVKDNGERFGTFVLNLNSLITNSIKGKVQEQSSIYFKHMEKMQEEFNKKLHEETSKAESETIKWKTECGKQIRKNAELSEKYTTTNMELMEVTDKYMTLQDTIITVIDLFKKEKGNVRTGKKLLKAIRFATARGAKEEQIEVLIDKMINEKVAEILEEKLANK